MTRPLCVFISLQDSSGHVLDDSLCRPYFEAKGWDLVEWAWNQDHDWQRARLLVFRSCYDYWEDLPKFTQFLNHLATLRIPIENHLRLIDWNLDKRYLFELEALGIPVLKSHLIDAHTSPVELKQIASLYPAGQKFVSKPCIGAGGFEMECLSSSGLAELKILKTSLLQAFQESVLDGEWSVIFFAGKPSHAVKKVARPGEYRVQDSHGGKTHPVSLDDHPRLVDASMAVAQAMKDLDLPNPSYARYDFLAGTNAEELLLVEVELLEPTLFLKHCPRAAENFSRALLESSAT